MVRCQLCNQIMSTSKGCLYTKIIYNGKIYNRIPFGGEFDLYAGDVNENDRCPDCGVKAGFCHHYRCCKENHPMTHTQMIDYELVDEFIIE